MALFHINHPSDVMNRNMAMNVIIPDTPTDRMDSQGRFPVIYLLHGYTDDYTRWMRMTSVERYANEHGIAVVMPDGGKSFYTDMAHGDPYFTYITEDIPQMLKKWFQLTDEPEYTYIAGLSMGGYGAMKIALTYPERFAVAASFSGALLTAQSAAATLPEDSEPWLKRVERDLHFVFEDVHQVVGGPNDVLHLATQAKAKGLALPKLFISCGTDDFILNNTQAFCQTLDGLEIPYDYHEEAAAHEWAFWDREIKRLMAAI